MLRMRSSVVFCSLLLVLSARAIAVHADDDRYDRDHDWDRPVATGAEWWQWALSIPTSSNPLLDPNGDNCMVGQRGDVWFLAGIFGGAGEVKRTCRVPEGVTLFFPVVNAVSFDTPGVCEQQGRLSVSTLRQTSREQLAAFGRFTVKLDGERVRSIYQLRSEVFALAFPEENVFDPFCPAPDGLPAGVYPRAVDEGFYASIADLKPGTHKLKIQVEDTAGDVVTTLSYTLKVVDRSR